MTDQERERRPGANRGGDDGDRRRSAADDTGPGRLDDPELLAEVGRVTAPAIAAARREHGRLLGTGTPEWWSADDGAKVAGVLVLGMAWLVHDPESAVRQRLRQMSYDLAGGLDWAAESRRPSRGTLAARRAEPGPMARPFDPVAARRWVETGSSREGAA